MEIGRQILACVADVCPVFCPNSLPPPLPPPLYRQILCKVFTPKCLYLSQN